MCAPVRSSGPADAARSAPTAPPSARWRCRCVRLQMCASPLHRATQRYCPAPRSRATSSAPIRALQQRAHARSRAAWPGAGWSLSGAGLRWCGGLSRSPRPGTRCSCKATACSGATLRSPRSWNTCRFPAAPHPRRAAAPLGRGGRRDDAARPGAVIVCIVRRWTRSGGASRTVSTQAGSGRSRPWRATNSSSPSRTLGVCPAARPASRGPFPAGGCSLRSRSAAF